MGLLHELFQMYASMRVYKSTIEMDYQDFVEAYTVIQNFYKEYIVKTDNKMPHVMVQKDGIMILICCRNLAFEK